MYLRKVKFFGKKIILVLKLFLMYSTIECRLFKLQLTGHPII